MSLVDTIDTGKPEKKQRACVIVGLCLFVGLILLLLSYGEFRESKFYGAPTDHCMFTNASSATEDCRHPEKGCDGLQRAFYYNTTDGTCTTNELYDYTECDCSDNPATTPSIGHGQAADKCWILSCESDDDWTFIEPVNEKAEAWISLIIGLSLTAFGIIYCCKCIEMEIDYDGATMIQEIGEKETYIRFYKKIESKETEIPSSWKTLHIVVTSLSIATPIILIAAFLIATFTAGGNISDNTISTGIQYRREYRVTFRFVEAMTMLSMILASFVSWCRQIQISVYFREYAAYFGAKQAKLYRWLNIIAMIFNFFGYLCILQLVSVDSARMTTQHALWAGSAFMCTATFLFLITIITTKQRYIEYRRYRTVEQHSPWIAMKHTFWYDALIMLILFTSGTIALFVFIGEIIEANIKWNKVPEDERENVFDYIEVFTGEWVSFFCLVSGIAVLALNFHHDHIAWEIHDYLQREVMLWPCAGCVFCCLGCCCCCCINVDSLTQMEHQMENEVEDKAQNDGAEMNEVDAGNENDGNNETEVVVAIMEMNL